jgi:phenylacetate-coenzyme A ligase PaaK-like adenylate-forming protein
VTPAADGPRRTPLEPWVFARAGAADLEGLHLRQLEMLRATVERARRLSAFYAERLAAVPPGEPRSLADLARLPFTTADDIRAGGMRMLCVPPGEVDRIVTLPTSGTTGEPKRIHFTAADQELTVDFFHHGMSVLVRPGQRVLVLLPGARPGSVGDLLRRGLERMDVEGVVHGPVTDPAQALRVLRAGRFDCIVGIPVQVLGLARRDAAGGAPVTLESVLLSTDQAPRSLVAAVERTWGCRVFDHYGTTETGLGGGVECEALDGCHLREADLLFEVVDPETGEPAPDGEYGEVVFTTLTREAMPLVRYRTGDRGRILAEPCPCGTPLRRLERVRARYCGRARLRGGGLIDQAVVDEPLFALSPVLDVRAVLRREPDRDILDVEVLAPGGGAALLGRAAAALESAPDLAGAVAAGQLRIELAVAATPWPQGVGTAKRTLVESGRTTEGTT